MTTAGYIAMQRAEAQFVTYLARWVRALLLAILGGIGWLLTNQYSISAGFAEIKTTLKQHATELGVHEQRLSTFDTRVQILADLKSGMESINKRIDYQDARFGDHTRAIATAEELLKQMTTTLTALSGAMERNQAQHQAIDYRLDRVDRLDRREGNVDNYRQVGGKPGNNGKRAERKATSLTADGVFIGKESDDDGK